MTIQEQIKKRSEQLIKEGVDPEAAVAIAVAEQVKKQMAQEEEDAKKKKELETVVAEGNKVVKDLKNLHRRLEDEANE